MFWEVGSAKDFCGTLTMTSLLSSDANVEKPFQADGNKESNELRSGPMVFPKPKPQSLNPQTLNALCKRMVSWALAKGLNLSYHKKEAILFTIDPYHGNLNP